MTSASPTSSAVFVALEVVGTLAFAVSGVMAAARASMDWLGAIVLAVVVAVGGGTIRDLLIGELPVAWLTHAWPVLAAIGTAVAVLAALRLWPRARLEDWTPLQIADAAGLSAFVILGTEIGLQAGLNPLLAVLVGTITGVGGGVLRDLLTGNRPMVLVGQIYAVAGLAGGSLFAVLTSAGINTQLAVWVSVATVFAIRLMAIRWNWNLPKALATPVRD